MLTGHLNWPSDSRRPKCPGPPGDWPEVGSAMATALALMMTLAARRTAVKNNFIFDASLSVWSSDNSRVRESEVTHDS